MRLDDNDNTCKRRLLYSGNRCSESNLYAMYYKANDPCAVLVKAVLVVCRRAVEGVRTVQSSQSSDNRMIFDNEVNDGKHVHTL